MLAEAEPERHIAILLQKMDQFLNNPK